MYYTKFIINLEAVTKMQLLALISLADSYLAEKDMNEISLCTSTEKDHKTKLEKYLIRYHIPYIKQ